MTIGEFKAMLEDDEDGRFNGVNDGSTIRVAAPDGSQLDVVGASAHDAAAKEKGERYLILKLDSPTFG